MNPSDHFFEGYAAARGASIVRPDNGRVVLRDALTIIPLDPPRQASLVIVPERGMLHVTALAIVSDRGTVAHFESVRVGDKQQFAGPVPLRTHGMGALHVFEVEYHDMPIVDGDAHELRLLITFECALAEASAALTIGAQYWKQADLQPCGTGWP